MVAVAVAPPPAAPELRVSVLTAALAVASIVLASVAAGGGLTAWMHLLLSDSARHPLPVGQQAAVGIVLGYALHRNGSCTRPLQSRVEVGVAAFEQGQAARLIFSGAQPGAMPRNVSEANAMAEYARSLVSQQPPPGRWLLEERSTSTRTNALFSLDIIEGAVQQQQQQQQQQGQEQPVSVLIVTSPFHQLRSWLTFRRAAQQRGLSLQIFTAKAPFAGHRGYGHWVLDAAADQADFWRELAAIAYYGVRGWL